MKTLGLDIGGANLKAAHSDGLVWSIPFELWQAPHLLIERLERIAGHHAPPWDRLAVTMTGELCDCFATRRQGVEHVLTAVELISASRPVDVWQSTGRFVDIDTARRHPDETGSANWLALATYLARRYSGGTTLLIDTGSTTTDVVRLIDDSPQPRARIDTDRLVTGELVYLGVDRTPVMTLGPMITWKGSSHRLMAECFATTGDIFLLTGNAPQHPDRVDTCDGRARTRTAAASRLLRMVGADLETATLDDAVALACSFAEVVYRRIGDAIEQVLRDDVPNRIVIAGSGTFVAQTAVPGIFPAIEPISLADLIGLDASAAACAYALVQLMDIPA